MINKKPVSAWLEVVPVKITSEQLANDVANFQGIITYCPSQGKGKTKLPAKYRAKARTKTHYSTVAKHLKLRNAQ